MEFIENVNVDLNELLEKENLKISKIDKLIDAGLIVPDNLLKDWGDYVRDEFMSNKTTELSDDTIYNLEFDKFLLYAKI